MKQHCPKIRKVIKIVEFQVCTYVQEMIEIGLKK